MGGREKEDAPIRLHEGEFVALIGESDNEHLLTCAFGPGWVGLRVIPENAWAFQRVAEMRGITT